MSKLSRQTNGKEKKVAMDNTNTNIGLRENADLQEVKEEIQEMKLTPKQKKWLELYLKTGNGTQSAMAAYDTTSLARAAEISYQNSKKLQVSIRSIAEAQGIDVGLLLRKAKEGLDATTSDVKGNTIADFNARARHLQILGKWTGVEPKPTPTVAQQINVDFPTRIEFVEGEIQDDN